MRDLFETLRYDHPGLYKTLIWLVALASVCTAFMTAPAWPLVQVLGITAGQSKVQALYHAAFWDIRAYMNSSDVVEIEETLYGSMVGVTKDGGLVISVPVGKAFVQKTVRLADIQITDIYGVASIIDQARGEDAKFEVYKNAQTVVWVRHAPFNVKLIESGYAMPDPNPPTNIVDKAFATYYWRIFNGTSGS